MAGVLFYRCGVAAELENCTFQQQEMFNVTVNKPELMKCYDSVNHRYTSKWSEITKIIC